MKTNASVCLFSASVTPSPASSLSFSCHAKDHKHITPSRAAELVADGLAYAMDAAGRRLRWTKRGELAALARINERLAIRGMSCKYGPYILTNAPVHVIMREAIAGG